MKLDFSMIITFIIYILYIYNYMEAYFLLYVEHCFLCFLFLFLPKLCSISSIPSDISSIALDILITFSMVNAIRMAFFIDLIVWFLSICYSPPKYLSSVHYIKPNLIFTLFMLYLFSCVVDIIVILVYQF